MIKAAGPWKKIDTRGFTRTWTEGVLDVMQALVITPRGTFGPTWCRLTRSGQVICDTVLKSPGGLETLYAIRHAIDEKALRLRGITSHDVILGWPARGLTVAFRTIAYEEREAARDAQLSQMNSIIRAQASTISSLSSIIATLRAMPSCAYRDEPPPYPASPRAKVQKIESTSP